MTSDRLMPEKMQDDIVLSLSEMGFEMESSYHFPMKCASIISISNLMMEFRQPIIL